MSDADHMLARFDALDRALVAKGFPPTSAWWRSQIERFYTSGRRTFVLRVGRRGGKSSTLCRLAVLEMLYGAHKIPPGDVGIAGVISVSKDEAGQRLRTVRAILDALGVKYGPIDGGIELRSRPVVCKVFAATVAGVVGGTWIIAIGDEVARWRDSDGNVNPATEVLASLRPTMATQPNAKLFLSSSPLGGSDAHAKAFEQGDTGRQLTAHAASWVANPTLSEEETRADEPDERVWAREYAAIPQVAAMAAFDPEAVAAAFDRSSAGLDPVNAPIVCTDPAGRGSDSWGYLVSGWCLPRPSDADLYVLDPELNTIPGVLAFVRDAAGRPLRRTDYRPPPRTLHIHSLGLIDAAYRSRRTAEDVYREIGEVAAMAGARILATDNFEAFSGGAWAKKFGMDHRMYAWTSTSKQKAVGRLRNYLHAEALAVAQEPLAPQLRRELLSFEERITAGGITYGGRDASGGHLDLMSCLLTMCMADEAGDLEGAPANNRVSGSIQVHMPGDYRTTY